MVSGNRVRTFSSARVVGTVAVLLAGTVAVGSATTAQAKEGSHPAAHGGAKQVYATGLAPSARTTLVNSAGKVVASQPSDPQGGVVFRNVKPAAGYRVEQPSISAKSAAVTVHTEAAKPWDPKVYNQTIPDHGYGYLTTRDGTKLAYYVHPPTSPAGLGLPDITLPPGIPDYAPPYPTLIEYAGYGYANPDGPESGIAILANLMGFAVVDVNMRGTGCSGGSFSFFERMQSLDGYDVIETVARQPWVKGHKVGMEGISYGGISQLFTAQTNPPSLAAIAPLSVIDATATTLEPGGILNDGFAVAWANERQHDAMPAGKNAGQGWALKRIQQGDKTCKANQVLHGEAQDLPATIAANTHYHPAYADTLDPLTFVHKIHVPTFMACQFEDEQTGGHCMDLAQHFTGTTKKWFTFTNGVHTDSLDPDTFNRWYDFLELYVAKQVPLLNSAVIKAAAPVVYQMALGLPSSDLVTLPIDPIQLDPTYDMALADFNSQPSIRVNFDNGAGKDPLGLFTAGNPYPAYGKSFSKFPIPGTIAKRWYFGPNGSLTSHRAAKAQTDRYTSDPHALPLTDFIGSTGGGGLWGNASQWHWNWKQNPKGTAVSYLTAPLKQDTTVIGAGSIQLWVKSSTPDVDLMATVSEVDPNHRETFVQGGWMRASERKLETRKHTIFAQPSTTLEPVPSFRQVDSAPMPKGKFVKVTIPLYYEGHAYRAGSRIRITIAAPNGTQPIWSFQHPRPEKGTSQVAVRFSKSMPSSLYLPVIPGVSIDSSFPPCGSLRNEPCRSYHPTANQKG
ncbi:MAG TPA: CocE/NonD family hydrolase [Mycobacteriales bacterium]|nr:CocE/NonD family hydrolase [Mycobacteriales bacterium]